MRNALDSLKNDQNRIAIGLAEVRTEFHFAKWLLGIFLLATISGIGSGIWWATTITANMRALEANVSEKAKSADVRFDKIEAALSKILEQGKAGSKPSAN